MSKDYLRNRPFMAVEISYVPAPNVDTSVKGWQEDEGAMKAMERVSFVDRINDTSKYAIIIDIINSEVVKNRSSKSGDDVMATYLGQYREKVTEALSVWAHREATKMRADG